MDALTCYEFLLSKGVQLQLRGADRLLAFPSDRLTAADRLEIRTNKHGLCELLGGSGGAGGATVSSMRPPMQNRWTGDAFRSRWGAESLLVSRYRREAGQVFKGFIGFDCETEYIEGSTAVPRLALVSASDGASHVIVHPDDAASFVLAHQTERFVFHNVAFDFLVVFRWLHSVGAMDAFDCWIALAHRRRFHDTMLLDQLLRNASSSGIPAMTPRDLGRVAADFTGLVIEKNNPYRHRFGELIGADWAVVDLGFFEYAIRDTVATVRSHKKMRCQALATMKSAGYGRDSDRTFLIDPKAVRQFGLLTELIQVGAAISLAVTKLRGLHIDRSAFKRTARLYRHQLGELVVEIQSRWPSIFKVDNRGELVLTAKSGQPSKSNKAIEECLLQAARDIGERRGETVVVPRTRKGQVSRSVKEWASYVSHHPFLKAWSAYEETAKLCQFLRNFEQPVIRPSYFVCTRTGRTSCSSPNLQQVPRRDEFREMVVAAPGHLLLSVDYSYVELVTLAATCKCRYGESRLAEVISDGVDPHCYTASILLGMDYDEFLDLKKCDAAKFKDWRQKAKPINFGVPGGMGAHGLMKYACQTYGVELGLSAAEQFRSRLIDEVYPELGEYLSDTSAEALASNLGVHLSIAVDAFNLKHGNSGAILGSIRKIVSGRPFRRTGEPYDEKYLAKTWHTLVEVNQNPSLDGALRGHDVGPRLEELLFQMLVPTITGRIRCDGNYTSQRNTPFQGLAADGAKLALMELFPRFRVVGFVHDEILIEMPDKRGRVARDSVDEAVEIIRTSMKQVTYGIPVQCDCTVSKCWSKRAEFISRGRWVHAWSPNDHSYD